MPKILRRLSWFQFFEISEGVRERHHVTVLAVHVEQIGLVRLLRAIADRFVRDDWPEPVRERVDHACAYASAGRASGDYERVDTARDQGRGERRAEEGGGILLYQQQILGSAADARIELDQVRAQLELEQCGRLLGPKAAVAGYVG